MIVENIFKNSLIIKIVNVISKFQENHDCENINQEQEDTIEVIILFKLIFLL